MEILQIYQGSNSPLTLTLNESVGSTAKPSVALYSGKVSETCDGVLLKAWTKSNMTVSGNTIVCPMTQSETASFPQGYAKLLVKIMGSNGEIKIYDALPARIVGRDDKEITL